MRIEALNIAKDAPTPEAYTTNLPDVEAGAMRNDIQRLEIIPRQVFRDFIFDTRRRAAIVAHRRCGKTVACIQKLVISAIAAPRRGLAPARFAYIGPTYGQTKDVAWAYLKYFTREVVGLKVSESDLSVTFPHNGARIRLYGADAYDRLRGGYNDGVVIDEMGDIDPRAWPEVILPTLSDYQGWAAFIGTPKGDNEFHTICRKAAKRDDWFWAELKASETGILKDSELLQAQSEMTPEQYAQEYECSFEAPIMGAIFAKDVLNSEKGGRICSLPYDRAADVVAAFDLGNGENMSVWVYQTVGKEIHMLRQFSGDPEHKDLPDFVDWLKALPYKVNRLVLPHDAEAMEMQTGKTRVQFFHDRGYSHITVLPRIAVDDRINAARVMFPRIWFDATGTVHGIKALRNYRSDYDEKKKVLSKNPRHDWASHPADAFMYALMAVDLSAPAPEPEIEDDWVV